MYVVTHKKKNFKSFSMMYKLFYRFILNYNATVCVFKDCISNHKNLARDTKERKCTILQNINSFCKLVLVWQAQCLNPQNEHCMFGLLIRDQKTN